jgi:hypothetical protein
VGLLDKIASLLSGNDGGARDTYRTTVRCSRCGEEISVRIDLDRELTPHYERGGTAYYVHKGVIGRGDNRCFQTIEVRLTFDAHKRPIGREITGGEFVAEDDPEGKQA